MKKQLSFEWDDKVPIEWREKFKRELDSTLEIYYRAINTLKIGRIKYNLFGVIGHIIVEEVDEEITTTKTSEVLETSEVSPKSVEPQNYVSPESEDPNAEVESFPNDSSEEVTTAKTSEVLKTSEVSQKSVEPQNYVSSESEDSNTEVESLPNDSFEDVTTAKTSEVLKRSEVSQKSVEPQNLISAQSKNRFCNNLLQLAIIICMNRSMLYHGIVRKSLRGIGYLRPT
jgi:hypothetical protein